MKSATFFFFIFLVPLDIFSFSYARFSDGYFTTIHVLTVDPKDHAIEPVRAWGKKVKRETVSAFAQRYGAAAAVNGGFWKQNGNPAGILKIGKHWHGTPIKPRGALGWANHGQTVLFDRVFTNVFLKNCLNESLIEVFPLSDPPSTTPEQWKEMEHIVGGAPLLISQGKIIEDFSSEQTLCSFLTRRYPRTAVGVKASGEWVFVVVDGRFYGLLGGVTIQRLAELMWQMGCVEALNLDGGGSSTLVIDDVVINTPCGKIRENRKRVEAVSDAILIFPSKG